MPTGIIEITFMDGGYKRIEDYGKKGSPWLKLFYDYFDDLRFSESWKKYTPGD